MNKKISEMTNEEILRQQLELLAETAQSCTEDYLSSITMAMCDVYRLLK